MHCVAKRKVFHKFKEKELVNKCKVLKTMIISKTNQQISRANEIISDIKFFQNFF